MLFSITYSRGLEGSWTTLGWSILALVFTGAGFLWKDINYRRTGLAIFSLSLLRIIIVDIQQLELYYRMFAFLGLGACLLAVSFLYSRFREEIRKWL